MKFISSDTNVWIDFFSIDKLDLPFKLPYKFIMYEITIENELIKPSDLGSKLKECGLESIDITEEEFYLAEEYNSVYKQPSLHDCIALAIAKCRNITLLTGDKHLRTAALNEGVTVMGTIGVLDQLIEGKYIKIEEYRECLSSLDQLNGGVVRLPSHLIKERLGKTR